MAGAAQSRQRGQQQQAREVKTQQEGSRWRFARPTGDKIAEWFKANVHLHEGLEHDNYVQGVVLIPSSEKVKITFQKPDNTHATIERWDQVFTPYAKVETRIAYFWDLIAKHPEWLGVIEPVPVPRTDQDGFRNLHLPRGFFRTPMQKSQQAWVDYLACTMRVRIFDRDACRIEVKEDPATGEPVQYIIGKTILDAPPATKMVPTLTGGSSPSVDSNLIMKAETGAIGRALGMAGMLVIPGSGVATAEDMQEAAAQSGGTLTSAPAEDATLPADAASLELPGAGPPAEGPPAEGPPADENEAALRARITELMTKLEGEPLDLFRAWAQEKKINVDDVKEHQLRGVLRKLEELSASSG